VEKIKVILGLAVFALVMSTGWQIAACELANVELKDDLKDVASLSGSRIGLAAQHTDNELRATVIRKAASHDIALHPELISVQRSGTEEFPVVFLAAKYQARVWLPGLRLVIHFTATSA
jgi:hypothetical protein